MERDSRGNGCHAFKQKETLKERRKLMNVLIASETPFGAVLCDAFWRKLILGSIDPYIAEKKNSLTFLYHGKSSAVPIAQESYNENYDQDFDAIKLVEFNDSQSYADSFSEIIHSKSYDIVVFVDAQNSVFNIEESAEELFAASKDA